MKTQYYTAASLRLISLRQVGTGFAKLHKEVARHDGAGVGAP